MITLTDTDATTEAGAALKAPDATGTTSDAVEILRRMLGETPADRAEMERIRQGMDLGEELYAAREAAGLTHQQLADKVGVSAQDVEDFEMANYDGDTGLLLAKIVLALGLRVDLRLVERAGPPAETTA